MKIYLAGPIRYSDDPHGWREAIQDDYPDHTFLNPLDWGEYTDGPAPQEVVSDDLFKLQYESDAVICKWENVETAGTPMELVYAYEIYDIPVVVVYDDPDDLSPWVKEHSDAITNGIDTAVVGLEAGYNIGKKIS